MSLRAILSFFYSGALRTYAASLGEKVRCACSLHIRNGWKTFRTTVQRRQATARKWRSRAAGKTQVLCTSRDYVTRTPPPGGRLGLAPAGFKPAPRPLVRTLSSTAGAPPTQVLGPQRVCLRGKLRQGACSWDHSCLSPHPRARKAASRSSDPHEQQGRTAGRGGGPQQARSKESACPATLKMAARQRRGPSEAVPAHAQRGVPARDTRWRQRRWGGRGGGGKTGGRAERVAASPRVRCGQVRAPGSHSPAASRARVRGPKPGGGGPLRRFPLEATACPVSAAAAILGPLGGGRAGDLDEGVGSGERGRTGL